MRGPISRRLWNRLRRRGRVYEGATAAAAAVAIYVAAAAEPNLSGQWSRGSTLLDVYHVGKRVEMYLPDGTLSVTATFTDDGSLQGTILVGWDADARARCGERFRTSFLEPVRIAVDADFDRLTENWSRDTERDCEVSGTQQARTTLVRR